MCWVYRVVREDGATAYEVGYFTFSHDDEGERLTCDWYSVAAFNTAHEARGLVNFLNGGNISTGI